MVAADRRAFFLEDGSPRSLPISFVSLNSHYSARLAEFINILSEQRCEQPNIGHEIANLAM